jgi:hypothetical protein
VLRLPRLKILTEPPKPTSDFPRQDGFQFSSGPRFLFQKLSDLVSSNLRIDLKIQEFIHLFEKSPSRASEICENPRRLRRSRMRHFNWALQQGRASPRIAMPMTES